MLAEVVEVVGAGTFRLVGELDLSSIGDVTAALEYAVPRRGDLTLDLSHLSFLGSGGVRLFIGLPVTEKGSDASCWPIPHRRSVGSWT